MERRSQPYTVFPRTLAKKRIYYAQFRDPETGARRSAVSTGCTRADDAVRWCERRLLEEKERAQREADAAKHITLAAYASGFWSSTGAYAQSRSARLFSCSKGYLEIAEGNTRNHILPVWGEWRLRDITTGKLDSWIVGLVRAGRLAPATINKILQTLRTILAQAVADGWLTENPAAFVRPVKAAGVERGILTVEEVTRLLASPAPWTDYRHYAINLLAATTGARMGEVRGLLVENVKADHVEIRQSWEQGHGLKEPKYGSVRDVPISERVAEALGRVIAETHAETLVFYGDAIDQPLSKSVIERQFYRALERIGISEAERRERGITFHSHRHFLNTLLRSRGVADSKVREITGHRSERMSDRYTHYEASDFAEVLDLQAVLLEAPAVSA